MKPRPNSVLGRKDCVVARNCGFVVGIGLIWLYESRFLKLAAKTRTRKPRDEEETDKRSGFEEERKCYLLEERTSLVQEKMSGMWIV